MCVYVGGGEGVGVCLWVCVWGGGHSKATVGFFLYFSVFFHFKLPVYSLLQETIPPPVSLFYMSGENPSLN